MNDGFIQNRHGIGPPVQDLIEKAFVAAGWTRVRPGKGFEVHPTMIWPLPGGEFGCQILGLPPKVRDKLKIPGDQRSIELKCSDPAERDALLLALAIHIRYRLGGCWCLAQATGAGTTVPGADLQRLQVLAQLKVASMEWTDLYDQLRAGTVLLLSTSGRERQKLIPTGKSGGPTVADRWERMAQSSLTIWMEGFLHSGVGISGSGKGAIATAIARMDPNALGKVDPTFLVSVPPICVAMAVGLRARINRHVGSRIEIREPLIQVVGAVWSMLDCERRLALHFLSATWTDGDVEKAFGYLEDPWLTGSILGAQTNTMSVSNRKDIRKRLEKASEAVALAFAKGPLSSYIAKVTKPFRPIRVVVPALHNRSIFCHSNAGTSMLMPEHTDREITPQHGECSPSSIREYTPVLTNSCPISYGNISKSSWVHVPRILIFSIISRVWAAIRRKDSEEYIGPVTPSRASRWMRCLMWIGVYRPMSKDNDQGKQAAGQAANRTKLPTGKGINDQSGDAADLGNRAFVPREGVIYQTPGLGPLCWDPYELPAGSRQEVPDADILKIDCFLNENPSAKERLSRGVLVKVLGFRPMHEPFGMTADELVYTLTNSAKGLADKYIESLIRMIDTAPDDMVHGKVHHLLMAMGSINIAGAWLQCRHNREALQGWKLFEGLDPYRVAAAAAWRKSVPLLYDQEQAAVAFADWWVAINLPAEAKNTPGKDPGVEALRHLIINLRPTMSVPTWHTAGSALRYAEEHPLSSTRFIPLFRELRIDLSSILPPP